jgi:ABC-type nitrate/sulfonate/bicarbonate transport system permease component
MWEALVKIFSIPMYILPSPSNIGKAFLDMRDMLGEHMLATLYETVFGILLAAFLGVLFAFMLHAIPLLRRMLYPLLALTQAIPILVIAPLLIIYLGFGMAPKIFTVVLMCFFPITVFFSAAMENVPEDRIHLLKSFGANRIHLYTKLYVPAALPAFFSGLRLAATYAVTGAVVGEWLSSEKGLGFIMIRAKNAYMLDRVFAIIFIIIAISLMLLGTVVLLERLYLKGKKAYR